MSPLVKAPSSEPVPVLHCSFKVYASDENKNLLRELRIMAAKDGDSFSDLIRAALGEYYERHKPGNPQLILGHWNSEIPLPKTVSDHHWKQMRDVYSEAGAAWVCVDENCREAWFQP